MANTRKKTINEDALVALLKTRENRGYNILYDNYSAALYGSILKIVRDEDVASDTLQDTFVKIWKNIDQYSKEKGTLFTWMLRMARNTAIDAYRSAGFQQSLQNSELEHSYASINSQYQVKTKVDGIGLDTVLNKLKPESRQIIDLLYYQGYTQAEVAEEYNIPLGTVKSRTKSALQYLRELLILLVSYILINHGY